MLWPPPTRGERVTLTCGCDATVKWRVPVVFFYRLHIYRTTNDCSHGVSGRAVFVFLEAIASRRPRSDDPGGRVGESATT